MSNIEDDPEIEFVQPPEWMSAREYLELCAVDFFCKSPIGSTFQSRRNWPFVRRLVRSGLVTWQDHPEMSKGFALVKITPAGRELVEKTKP